MNAEIIAVGSELLLGQITNTNAQFLSQHLSELGINVYYHTVVGDNPQRLEEAVAIAQKRANVIIFSGGLGPTKDDLTKETIARVVGRKLVTDEMAMQSIEQFFASRNRVMTENNKKQALVLEGSHVFPNKNGMAPGMALETETHTYMLFPGPPHELEPMFQFEAKPYLAAKLCDDESIILSHVMHFFGIGEAELELRIQHILDAQTNPTVAPLASAGEVKLRITAKAKTIAEATQLNEDMTKQLQAIVGQYQYGVNDDTIVSKTVEMLQRHELTIAAAESLTAGLFQAELAEINGVSAVLAGGVVAYNEDVKVQQLGIDRALIEQHSVVSAEVAAAMAIGVRDKFQTNIGIGLTGAAGPNSHGDQPPGTVFIGIDVQGDVKTYKLNLSGMRNTNRIRTVKYACHYIMQQLVANGYEK
ncbi:competence/damage-inducible protein A [Caryophanon latum]|uniref:Putative competence-damage inducible protein n=1 Tax=Caryophanon latum TaxID=33977 RepID=A0A1C0YYY3_9BACL|nr:competence/damage-inducible protein A [Caryophanon latum]OCS92385.1 competence/damage-inducible protein A [Caryophanon latum]